MRARWLAGVTIGIALAARPVFAAEPVVSVWYRGTPAGVPRLEDLRAIRAAGLSAVTWPSEAGRLDELSDLAARAGLMVVLQPDRRSLELVGRADVDVTRISADQIPALGWRAIARGVRTISFDPGQESGTGLQARDGTLAEWVRVAALFSRQLSANAELFDVLQPAPTPKTSGSEAVEVTLAQSPRAWVLFVTNAGDARATADVQMPPGVPYAIWVSLIDGSTIGMRDRPDGARWSFALVAGEAAVYVIDK